jgi:hypothetical protein
VVSDGLLLLVDFALGCIDGDGAEDDHLLGAGWLGSSLVVLNYCII